MKQKVILAAAVIAVLALGSTLAYANCGFCGIGKKHKEAGKIHEAKINTAGLAALVAAKTPMIIIDARSGKYDDGKRIPGAKSLNAESGDDEVKAMLPDKAALIVVYCQNPECPASPQLAEKLRKMGYTNVLECPEGIEGWQKAGHAIESVEKPK